jgi:hypothetical protein
MSAAGIDALPVLTGAELFSRVFADYQAAASTILNLEAMAGDNDAAIEQGVTRREAALWALIRTRAKLPWQIAAKAELLETMLAETDLQYADGREFMLCASIRMDCASLHK